MRLLRVSTIGTYAALFLIAFAVLWKGGKTVDATWIFALVSACMGLSLVWFAPTKVPTPTVWLSGAAFAVLTIISYITTSTANYGLDEVMHTAALFLLFLWLVAYDSPALRLTVVRTIAVSTMLAVLIGIAVYLLQPVSRFVGSFFDYRFHTDYWPNAWAEYVLLTWPIVLVSLRSSIRDTRSITIRIGVLSLLLASLFLSFSRGAFLCFLAQLFVLGLILLWKKRSSLKFRTIAPIIGAVTFCSLILFFGINSIREKMYPVESVVLKASFSSAEGTSSISERSSFWHQAIELARRKPILGYGPYSFRFVQPGIQDEVLATSDHPHNVFLKYAAERGIPATFFYILFLLVIGIGYLRTVGRSWFEMCAGIGIFGALLHNMIDFNLQFLGISIVLFVLLAFVSPTVEKPKASTLARLITALLSISLLLITLTEGYGLYRSSLARHAWATGDATQALQEYASVEWVWFSRDDWLTRSIIALEQKNYLTAEAYAQRYIVLNQSDARGFRLLGDIYLAWGQREDALRAYEKAYNRSSRNDLGIARGYATLLAEKPADLDRLRPEFDHLLLDFEEAILMNAHFVALSKNVEEFDQLTRLLARVYPEDREIYASMRARVTEHAETERAQYRARPSGFLW